MRSQATRSAIAALALLFLSWLAIQAGIFLGATFVQPGEGYVQKSGVTADLFRFDAEYYLDIANHGYAYNGEPYSSPNIVFAPLFPLIVRLVSDLFESEPVGTGFALNKIFFCLGLFFLFSYLSQAFDEKRAFLMSAAMVTSAGSYAFHAFYSESAMWLSLGIILWAYKKQRWVTLAFGSAAIGASRLSSLPICCVVAGVLALRAWKLREQPREAATAIILSAVALTGAGAYLVFLAWHFGNPFVLLPEIQSASWGFFHPPNSLLYTLSGKNLVDFAVAAAGRGWYTFVDIKTLNLIWTLLALVSTIYVWRKFGACFFSALFTGYFLFIYVTGGGSEYLISAHRFFAMMIPIFLMFSDAAGRLAAGGRRALANVVVAFLLCLNLAYCLLHTALFNQGIWFYF